MKVTNSDMPDDLLTKYLTGEATPNENSQAEEWINTNDANRQYYEQLKITVEPDKPTEADNNAEAWQRLQNLISKNHGGHINKPVNRFRARWVQLVVSVALIFLMCYIIRNRLYSNVDLTLSSGANITTETLPDGSIITLNTQSQITYPAHFTGNKRVINLVGEAFLKIVPNTKPFIVNVKGTTVNSNTASVDIKCHRGKTEVAVTTGTVTVVSHGKRALLRAREKESIDESGTMLKENNEQNNPAIWAVAH